MVLQAEHTEQPDMQGTFLLLHLLTRVAFVSRSIPGPTRMADPNRVRGARL